MLKCAACEHTALLAPNPTSSPGEKPGHRSTRHSLLLAQSAAGQRLSSFPQLPSARRGDVCMPGIGLLGSGSTELRIVSTV